MAVLRGKGRYAVKLRVKPTRCYLLIRGRGKAAQAVRFITKQTGFRHLADARMVCYWLNKRPRRVEQ